MPWWGQQDHVLGEADRYEVTGLADDGRVPRQRRDHRGPVPHGRVEQRLLEMRHMAEVVVLAGSAHAVLLGSAHSPLSANFSSVARYGAMSMPCSASQASSK